MRTKKSRIETISETTTLLILKSTEIDMRRAWCERCMEEVVWIRSVEIDPARIPGLPGWRAVHIDDGFVCMRSLLKEISKGEKL